VRKRGFVIQSTIEDLLLGYGKLTLEGGIKNPKGAFSTVSSQADTGKNQSQLLLTIRMVARDGCEAYDTLYVTNPVFSSDWCGLYGIILYKFFGVVKS